MKVAGIVAEYNPFHNGHKHHLLETKKAGADYIIAVMSGNFVQRSDAAIFDKWTRTKAALLNGVDLVIELPVEYSTATAEKFSSGAVNILNQLNCVDFLSFGSESADLDRLLQAAAINLDGSLDQLIKLELESGKTYARARSNAVERLYGKSLSTVFETPNDILAIEYICALKKFNSKIQPKVIKRVGAEHDKKGTDELKPSASYIRQLIFENKDYSLFVPKTALEVFKAEIENKRAPVSLKSGESAILWQLRKAEVDDFQQLCDVSEGLDFKLFKAVRSATSLNDLYSKVKSKRYTHARVRRLILSYLLSTFNYPELNYLRVLGINNKGEQLLKIINKSCKLPVVTSYKEAQQIGNAIKSDFEKKSLHTDFYTLLMPEVLPCGEEMRQSIVKI